MTRPARGRSGFTLIEVLVAMAIASLALVTIMYTVARHLDAAGRLESMHTASTLAMDLMSEADPRTKLSLAAKSGTFPDPYGAYTFDVVYRKTTNRLLNELVVTVRGKGEEVVLRKIVLNPAGGKL